MNQSDYPERVNAISITSYSKNCEAAANERAGIRKK